MDPTINAGPDPERNIAGFYDWLAPDYDQMTGFEKRFAHEKPFFRLLVENNGIRSAVDAGCGTGFHSFLLAQLGVDVTAVDVSPIMIEGLRKHSSALGYPIKAVVAGFSDLPGLLKLPADAVFCMGNTLAHMLSREQLCESLGAFHTLLKPGGILFAQTLNYDRILATREKIQSVKEIGGTTFIRYYEYHAENILFTILKLTRDAAGVHHAVQSVELRPVLTKEIVPMLEDAGLVDVRLFGGITMEQFDPSESKDLVLIARKASA